MLTWKRGLLACLAFAALASSAEVEAQTPMFGLGGTYGSVNDVSNTFNLDGFKPSEWTVFFDYRVERTTLLRITFGSMWTEQALVGQTVNTPQGPVFVPTAKEHVNYLTVDASYLYAQGFYTGGIFGGLGGYQYNPEPMPPGYEAFQDPNQKYFGFNLGVDGEFRVSKNAGIVLRLTYHYLFATPRRQFFNAAAGLVGRF
ncbi:MAG TPA: outer membrane beta-barrel protein [Thermoanaerobaculia bacterium]|nr:outer membrane beta-barrel protein [Thermoanaerobaculia bacterium]